MTIIHGIDIKLIVVEILFQSSTLKIEFLHEAYWHNNKLLESIIIYFSCHAD